MVVYVFEKDDLINEIMGEEDIEIDPIEVYENTIHVSGTKTEYEIIEENGTRHIYHAENFYLVVDSNIENC